MNSRQLGSWLMVIGGLALMVAPWIDQLAIPFAGPIIKQDGAWVIMIEETEERTPELAIVFNATKYWKELETRGLRYRWYDIDSDEASKYRGGPAPRLVIESKDGKQLHDGPMPMTIEGLDAIVRKVTGL